YDIWVRLPRGTVHNDSRATYEITTSFGVETVTLDHTADNDTWINLGKYGFELLHDTDVQLRLLNGPAAPGDAAAESLLADAVIVAPHQD
ncbi:hypothetical protein, partial [Streptosporangium sp. OZ121]|uniref:hypothetical protein n=1 Tax=Streptosporangium sp. OZ121 TaxID=3444183 RepID=UPI003F79D219